MHFFPTSQSFYCNLKFEEIIERGRKSKVKQTLNILYQNLLGSTYFKHALKPATSDVYFSSSYPWRKTDSFCLNKSCKTRLVFSVVWLSVTKFYGFFCNLQPFITDLCSFKHVERDTLCLLPQYTIFTIQVGRKIGKSINSCIDMLCRATYMGTNPSLRKMGGLEMSNIK